MSFFNSMNVSATGLTAQRLRMDIISQNIANVNTTKTKDGGPYKRKVLLFEEQSSTDFNSMLNNSINNYTASGVKVSKIIEDTAPLKSVYDPSHPEADKDGYVLMPNVNTVEEMVNMISANRSYEANVTAMNAAKSMAMKSLEIGK
ncbi:flagellar basal-body rod protein FlgC [Vallitalea longa]|uniref:Flagellar basal-body rod protein FlgC n=1 Tax=Vallitalea longa TaxID=2936439 RepID=A0A9W5Y8V0_9FIRM|nr:flagellar basal body rod protein FlgC [Vallitalea longa]GKX28992.1 flagellar basal-body rod protein FlgC [Vallitalea longa]